MCRGSFPMFYYDPATRTCQQFVYGGCRGNENVHKTSEECYAKCDPIGKTRGGRGKMTLMDYLTLLGGKGQHVFTFPGRDAAMRVDDYSLAQFSVRNVYQLDCYFRTDSPHGLIAFLRQTSVPPELGNKMVQLYVFIRRGHLGVTHIFCHNTETFLMNKGGVQAGNWHSSMVKVDSGTGQLLLEVDGIQETFTITSLRDQPHYGASEGAAFISRLWIGGVFEEDVDQEQMVGRTANFHGCMKNIAIMSGETSEEIVRHKGLISSTYRGVRERCSSNCDSRFRNLCAPTSHCIEHFDHSTCSCFGSGKDGRRCNEPDIPIVSLSNDGHVVHRLYDWMDRVHSYINFISLEFRTRFTDSILFFASGQYPEKQYIAATLTAAGRVYVEANLGGGAQGIEVGTRLNTGTWQTLILLHQHNTIQVHLNSRLHGTLNMPGEVRYFHLDPDFYLGSAPNLTRTCGLRHDPGLREGYSCQRNHTRYYYDVHNAECHAFDYSDCGGNGNNFPDYSSCMSTCRVPGLRSMHSFLGCFKNVFINEVSVLWELKMGNKTTRYYGPTEETPFTNTCRDRDQSVLLTLSTERSHVNLTNPTPDSFKLAVSFRPTTPRGAVASGYVDVLDIRSEWEIHHDETHITFVIHDNLVYVKPTAKISIGNWQYVEVSYNDGKILMRVNLKYVSNRTPGPLTFHPIVTLGISPLQEYPGMVGCVRKVKLGGQMVDLRSLVGTDLAHKDATYDGCRVLGPCQRPGACEHGTTCSLGDNDEIRCDCTGSGYTGKTCYFSLYKTSCEQYRQIGYNTSGVYKIDVDGNGPFPPAFVRCQFNSLTGVTSTIVENNLPENYEVRGPNVGNVKLNIEYRDFSPEMLQALVTKSKSCTQKVTYDCRRSPLKLSTHTWFSSPSEQFITSFGSKVPGLCRCREVGTCDKEDVACNCDAVDGLARSDMAVFSDPKLLPLTSMVFLEEQEGQREESEGRITLGPLTCTNEAIVEQAASFSKDGVYLEVPAWRKGSLAFSFKTTSSRAVIAYQPAYHPDHATFRIALLGDKEVEFMYTFHGLEHRHSLHTTRRLNTGEWQQLLIDIHLHQLRLLINSEQELIDIEDDANLGVLDGSMFLGGMPKKLPEWKNQELEEEKQLRSLKGCIRDLTLNDELVDLDRYVRASPLGVSSSCKSSCKPNPCKNGAKCIEKWGSFECVCTNSLAHSGNLCEINQNEDAVTFTKQESKLKYFGNSTANLWTDSLLNRTSLRLNFRTNAQQGLILFTYDYLHNFLQLHLASPTRLVMLFNSGKKAIALPLETTVALNGGQSVQVALQRTSSSTTLTVSTSDILFNATTNSGLQLLEDGEYEQFPFGESTPLADMVYYPHSFTRPGPFFKVYLGSAEDPQWDVRTEVPGFVGCLRGLQVDANPMSLSRLLAQNPDEGVRKNCTMMCDRSPCLNGGVCKEDFRYPSNFRCDCSGTSYTGPVCSGETAYTFHGREWLGRDAATSPLVEGLVLELAFSASRRHLNNQVVAFLRSTNPDSPHDYILLAVRPDGTVGVDAVLKSLSPDVLFFVRASPEEGVNAFSGHRHAVRVEWQGSGLVVTVDGKEQTVRLSEGVADRKELTTSPRSFYLGGVEAGADDRFYEYDNFHGCISNVMLSNPEGKVYPLQEYSEHDLHITNFGLPGYGSCAGFTAAPVMVLAYQQKTNLEAVNGGEWSMRTARRMGYAAPPPISAPQRDTPMDNVVPAVAGSVLVVIGVIVVGLCVKVTRKTKKAEKEEERKKKEEDRQTLLRDQQRTREAAMKARAAKVTAVEMTPLLPAQNGGTRAQDMVVKVSEAALQEAPLTDPPPPTPSESEAPEEDEVEIRTPTETTGDRPLSWDKFADRLPLIIGTQEKPQEKAGDSSASSEGSSFDCTIDITESPVSSQVFPPPPNSGAADSPSSMRVNRGSSTMVYMEEDTDAESEPRLLRHGSLPAEDEPVEMEEPPGDAKQIHPLGDGEVQKIVKSDEDEIVVVDDYLEDKEAAEGEAGEGDAEEESNQQKKDELAEAAQESSPTDSETEAKADQFFESAREEQEEEEAKENEEKDEDNKPIQDDKDREEDERPSGEEEGMEDAQTEAEEETKQEEESSDGKKRSDSSSSDSDFIELRPESEKVLDCQRVSSQTRQEPKSRPSTFTPRENDDDEDDEKLPSEKLPIEKHNSKETEEREETASEESEAERNEDEAVKEEFAEEEKDAGECSGEAAQDQEMEMKGSEERGASEGEDDDTDEKTSGKTSPQPQQGEFEGTVSTLAPPEIIVSSPKEEPEQDRGYLLTQIYDFMNEQKEGIVGEADVQDSQVSSEEDNEQVRGFESPLEQRTSELQDQNQEIKISNIGEDDEDSETKSKEDEFTEETEGEDTHENKEEDDVDVATGENSTENDEHPNENSSLAFLDMTAQLEGHFPQPDNCPGSPLSDGSGLESPTYLNYVQDDDICLATIGTPARCSPGNLTPLDPISELDESEEEKDEDETQKTSLPTLFMSKFSSGVVNLSTLPGEEEDSPQDNSSSENEARNAAEDTFPDASVEDAAGQDTSRRKLRKKGHVTREKPGPILLPGGVRTFSNPVSYLLGGPNVQYEEEGEEGEGRSRQRNDSIASTTSLD